MKLFPYPRTVRRGLFWLFRISGPRDLRYLIGRKYDQVGTFSINFYGLHVWDTRSRVPCIPRGLLFSWNLYGLILYFKVHWWSWKQNPKREFRSKIAYFWKMCNFWCSILWNISWWVSMKSFDWSIMTLRSTDFSFWLCSVWQLWNLFLKHEIAKVSLVSGSKTGSKTAENGRKRKNDFNLNKFRLYIKSI